MSYSEFFQRLTGNEPLPYQETHAKTPFSSKILIVSTGLGKTDTVLVPWLYAHASQQIDAPKRFIAVLPRQNLTAQTAANARKRVQSAGLEIPVFELMAGSRDNREHILPHRPAIIIATQDLYFSRALNRGYARRPPRWPVDFALYNQDCLLVFDEIQLMDDALATSRQLAAFRERFQTFGPAPCIWMSATVNTAWLQTVDAPALPPILTLSDADQHSPVVNKRVHAPKTLAPAPPDCRAPAGCALFAHARHTPGTRTLVIANTVARAREIYANLEPLAPGRTMLLHSRFRPAERRALAGRLTNRAEGVDQFVVATQVLEAGVDITAECLVTDIAPWGSLVQRFGRVNRYGDNTKSEVWWVDEPAVGKQKDPYAPYAAEEIARSREKLRTLNSASPAGLPVEDGPEPWQHVLRRNDLLDLFDTTPDISGNDLDVSRFIRATEDRDVFIAWRDWPGTGAGPSEETPELSDDELCPVPIGELREFLRKPRAAYTWSFALETWQPVERDRLFPGMTVLLRSSEGGYKPEHGWSPDSKTLVPPVPAPESVVEGDTRDRLTFLNYTQTLRDHTRRVCEQLDALLAVLPLDAPLADALRTAALKHDWGKTHEEFQRTLRGTAPDFLAKQVGTSRHKRPHLRHELASALAMLDTGQSNLAAYLVAAHHGRIRMNIRSMPGEQQPGNGATARGIIEGDALPACEIADGIHLPPVTLSLRYMSFGEADGSWTSRALQLLEEFGPFRLAWLEMLLRIADAEASATPDQEVPCLA